MSGHTKEPWRVNSEQRFVIEDRGSIQVAVCMASPDEANARRIVDCVNAFEGLNPSALAGLIEEVSETIERLDARGMSSLSLRTALANLRGDA